MENPDTILAAIVTTLRSNADLVTFLGNDSAHIRTYDWDFKQGAAGSNLEQTTISQDMNTALVYYKGTRTGTFSKMEAVKHDFGVSFKPYGKVGTAFYHFREGVCATDGLGTSKNQKFKHIQVHPSVRLPEELQINIRTLFVSQQYGLFDFADINFTLTERGVDN